MRESINYWRAAIFSLLVLLALLFPGVVLAGILGWKHQLFGHTLEQVTANFRLMDNTATCVTASITYVWLLRPLKKRLAAHVLIVFFVAETIQFLAARVLGDTLANASIWRAFLVDGLYAVIGLFLVIVWRFVCSRTVVY